MISQDVMRKMRCIEIHTKRLLRGSLPGDSRSSQKGIGFDFDQIRDYQVGDDVRFIDWSASARMNTLLVKQYTESRSREVVLAVDISGSTSFSSGADKKRDTMAQVASTLALIAEQSNDRVGLLLFSDQVEAYIPPRKGMAHVRAIMKALFTYKAAGTCTAFDPLFQKLAALKRKDAIVFLVSDFIGHIPQKYSACIARLYTLVAVRCLDKNERTIPEVGFIPLRDIETGATVIIDTRRAGNQVAGNRRMKQLLAARLEEQNTWFKKQGIATLDVFVDRPFIDDMVSFFKRRV